MGLKISFGEYLTAVPELYTTKMKNTQHCKYSIFCRFANLSPASFKPVPLHHQFCDMVLNVGNDIRLFHIPAPIVGPVRFGFRKDFK